MRRMQFADPYQQVEASDISKGGTDGDAGERDLTEVPDKHDRYHLDGVLQEGSDNERPGKVKQFPDLNHHRVLCSVSGVLSLSYASGRVLLHHT